MSGYFVRLLVLFGSFRLTEVVIETLLFLNRLPAGCMEPPVLEPKLDINFSALEPHFGHFADFSASLIGRISSNSLPHLGQRYSYIALGHASLGLNAPSSASLSHYITWQAESRPRDTKTG